MNTPPFPPPATDSHDAESIFRELHTALADFLLKELRQEGGPRVEVLRQARELLRDNGITDAGRGENAGGRLHDILKALPFREAE